ncbi:MAG: DUF58 domain-containing protein [Flavobacteriaceae bacterium]|nr:DUF58 domain-containing protein [Flavobacteriaceae bacterium]
MTAELSPASFEQLGSLKILARQVVEGFITGLHKSPFHGFSVEFSEHRQYNPGESIRHIDWKLMARSDKTFVKRYEDETNLRCQLVIDNSSSMYFPEGAKSKIHFSAFASACLAYLLRGQRDAFGLTVVNDGIAYHTPAKSTQAHQQLLFGKLEELMHSPKPNTGTRLAPALHQLADSLHKRSLVVLFSDMMEESLQMDDFFQALQHLRYCKHEVILFHVADREKELQFDFANRPYQFIDMESGETIRLQPSEVKEQYLQNMKQFMDGLQNTCAQYKIDLVEAPAGDDYRQILLTFLAKRAGMG